jgi:hypothetical protein
LSTARQLPSNKQPVKNVDMRAPTEGISVLVPSHRSRQKTYKAKANEISTPTPVTRPSRVPSKRKPETAANAETKKKLNRESGRFQREPTNQSRKLNSVVESSDSKGGGIFSSMAFAVSYVREMDDKTAVSELITSNGGHILEDGFENLFERTKNGSEESTLILSKEATKIGFAALIADEHSRKAKYMQALALGLPCISGRWVSACAAKREILDWVPYLLCAGQSSFLGNAMRSRTLRPYSAKDAKLSNTFEQRETPLKGQSILLVTGKGRAEETRKAYVFLAHVWAPRRICQVHDHETARKKLVEDPSWDLLYVDKNESAAEAAIFGSKSATKKRKRGPTASEDATPPPKKIRIISDEVVIQSLILGQLLEPDV